MATLGLFKTYDAVAYAQLILDIILDISMVGGHLLILEAIGVNIAISKVVIPQAGFYVAHFV